MEPPGPGSRDEGMGERVRGELIDTRRQAECLVRIQAVERRDALELRMAERDGQKVLYNPYYELQSPVS